MPTNYACNPPPTAITVGGSSYPIDTDYRTWIKVLRLMEDIDPGATETSDHLRNRKAILDIQTAVFGGELADEDTGEVMCAISDFASGYPAAPMNGIRQNHAQTYSFEWDLNYIVIAIRAQYGVDLSYRRTEPFHWWEFLLLFNGLCGDHYILRLMEIRGYTGKDPEQRKMAARFALPEHKTAREEREEAAFLAMFEPEGGEEQ